MKFYKNLDFKEMLVFKLDNYLYLIRFYLKNEKIKNFNAQ